MSRLVSPCELPITANPLADILADTVDFGMLVRSQSKLLVTATNV